MKNNCLIIAGEKSGEEHCESFFSKLRELCPDIHFWGVGGDYLESQGMELVYHLRDFSSLGFTSVICKIPFYIKALKRIEKMVERRNCKCAILVDFQDFNFRLAKKLKKKGVEILYYVAPQAWAWKEYRAGVLGQTVNTLFTILPFEKDWFSQRGVKNVIGTAHPILQRFNAIRKCRSDNKNILLLPGSRSIEVKNLLPLFIDVVSAIRRKHNVSILLVQSSNVDPALYEPYLKECDKVYMDNELEIALENAWVSIAASGTVTLATALFSIPTIVTYKVSKINWWVFKTFVSYSGPVSLANIVHQKRLFPELIQENATTQNIEIALEDWFADDKECERIETELAKTKDMLLGDQVCIAEYMGKVISEAYRK